MENKNLKNILVAAGLAVFAGVLTLGVNAAFGSVDAPTQNPVDASLHSPRFNDVDVNGVIKNSTVVKEGMSEVSKGVKIDDTVEITGGLSAEYNTSLNGGLGVQDDLNAYSNVNVSGDLTVNHNLKVVDAIKANTVDEKVTINGGIDVSGDSSRFTPIFENKSTIEIDGDIKLTDTDSLIYNDTDSPVSIFDNLDVDYDLTVAGAATADRFGTYFEENSTLDIIYKNTTKQVSVSCPANTYLVSCQSRSAYSTLTSGGSDDFTSKFTKDVYINYAYADLDSDNDGNATENDNVCKVRGTNVSATLDRYIGATAICLNPSI